MAMRSCATKALMLSCESTSRDVMAAWDAFLHKCKCTSTGKDLYTADKGTFLRLAVGLRDEDPSSVVGKLDDN
eukprot:11063526-Prorocentrum_lima.AAC.1